MFTSCGKSGVARARGGRWAAKGVDVAVNATGDQQGQKPLAIGLTAGQRGESPQFIPVLAAIRVPRLTTGRPRTRPDRVLADKTYTSKANRAYLRRRGIAATIPSNADHRGSSPGPGSLPDGLRPSSGVLAVHRRSSSAPM
ncbi:transposase [Micromonospora sp. NPDC005113]